MRKITKIRRSIKAISPVISVLLMIAIAVVASLVVYAWIMGYIGGTTTKTGQAIQIQSFAKDQDGNLIVYVQNVGQGTVQLDPAGAVYVNNALVSISTVDGNQASGAITIAAGQTVALVVNSQYNGEQITIKVVTTGGTFMQTTGTGGSGGGSATLTSTTLSCSVSPSTITVGESVTASGSLTLTDGSTGVSGKTVTITYQLAGHDDVVHTQTTDASGAYSDQYTPDAAGSWSVTASFAGDSTYALSTSIERSLTVNVAITVTSSVTGSGFVKVDGNAITTPQTFNWIPGSSHTIEALSPVSGPTNTQYVYSSWSDSGAQSHTYTTPTSAATVTANYITQYQVTVTASPSGAIGGTFQVTYTAGGTIYTNEQHTTSWTQWVDASTAVTVSSPQSPFNGYTFSSYTNNGVTMSSAQTITLVYQTSGVSITFTTSGTGSDASGTILTIDGTTYAYSALPHTFTWTPGSTHSVTATNPVGAGSGKQYSWTSWTNAGGLTANGGTSGQPGGTYTVPSSTTTVTANYKTQYQVTFDASSNVKGDSAATIVTAAGIAKTGAQLPYTAWYDSGSSLTYSYASPIASSGSPSTTQYLWSSTSGLSQTLQTNTFTVGGTGTITATYTTQTFGIDTNCEGFGSVASGTSITTSSMTAQASELIVVVITGNSNSPTVSSITDNFGTHLTYTSEVSYTSSSAGQCLYVYYATTGTHTGSFTVTVTMSSTHTYTVQAFGITGANTATPFDTNTNLPATARGTSSSTPTVTGVSTSNAHDMILAFEGQTSSTTQTAGSSFTAPAALLHNVNSQGNNVEYQIVTSTQSSISVSFGTSVNTWIMGVDAVQRAW